MRRQKTPFQRRRYKRSRMLCGPVEHCVRRLVNIEVACVVIVIACAGAQALFGLEVFVVQSASMAPAVPANALAVVAAVTEPAQVVVGDVVAYRMQVTSAYDTESVMVLHRVVAHDAEARTFITQGDANTSPDPAVVAYDAILGNCVVVVPALGYAVQVWSKYRWLIVAALGVFNGVLIIAAHYEITTRRSRYRRSP